MFFPAQGPADRSGGALRALRRSMNAPVVAIEDLPVGPARAAIALHGGPPDRVSLTVAVRSVRTGQTIFFTPEEELLELRSPPVALDAALSFAESMGFLFDDDEVEARGAAGPREAAALWREFIDPGSAEDTAPLAPEIPAVAPAAPARPAARPPAPTPEPAARESRTHAPESEPEESTPFWLRVPLRKRTKTREAVDAQTVLAPAPEPRRPAVRDVGRKVARREPRPRLPRGGEPETRRETPAGPEGRDSGELLRHVLAETALDRICTPSDRTEVPLTKFRRGGAEKRHEAPAAGRGGPSPREPRPQRAAEDEPGGERADLRLRLLSRF